MRCLTVLVFLFLAGYGDVVTDDYVTYKDAVKDNLFIRGWLPEILPQSTRDIRTENNLDLNTSVVSLLFRYVT